MSIGSFFLFLAVVAWGVGTFDKSGHFNWLCAGLCLAGIGTWFA